MIDKVLHLPFADKMALVSTFCTVVSLVTVIILFIERAEKKRPYLQISFELVRSSLVCLVIRNVGEVPATLKEVKFNPEFVRQMSQNAQIHAQDRTDLNISIHPKQQWVLCLDEITPTVVKYQNTQLEVSFVYAAKGKRRPKYRDTETINFNDYSGFMVYISEVDELKNEVRDLIKAMKAMTRPLNKIAERQPTAIRTDTYHNMDEVCTRTAVTGFQENTVIRSDEGKSSD